METGLKFSLFADQGAFLAAELFDAFLELGEFGLEFGDLVFPSEDGTGGIAGAMTVGGATGVDAMSAEQFSLGCDVSEVAATVAPGDGGAGQVGNDPRGVEQASQEWLHGGIRLDHSQGRLSMCRVGEGGCCRGRTLQGEWRETGATFAGCVQLGEDLPGGLRLFGQHELEMVAEGGLDCGNMGFRNAQPVGERAQDLVGLLQGGEGAGTIAFVTGLQLFEDVEA